MAIRRCAIGGLPEGCENFGGAEGDDKAGAFGDEDVEHAAVEGALFRREMGEDGEDCRGGHGVERAGCRRTVNG